MKDGIKLLLEEVKKVSDIQNNEMKEYKAQVKNTIMNLINDNKLDDAIAILTEYQQIVSDDPEALLLKSRILVNLLKNKVNSIDCEI